MVFRRHAFLTSSQETDERTLLDSQSDLRSIEQQLEKESASREALTQQQAKRELDLREAGDKLRDKQSRLDRFGFETKQHE